jgi:dienelactone hydrolase
MARNSQTFHAFQKLADGIRPKLAWKATSRAAHAAWRKRFRPKLMELLGTLPPKLPLEVHWAANETKESDAWVRRKVYVRSEAEYWVPVYLFVPKPFKPRRPAIICLHGHSGILPYIREGDEKQLAMARDHATDYAPFLAEHGYVTAAVVQRGWNETREGDPASEPGRGCHRVSMDAFLTGRTAAGLRAWDAMCVLTFLQSLKEVDPDRIGAGGLSGGGTTTLFFAAIDERVKLAMIAGYFCTFRDSIYTIHHCICNCVPGIMEWAEMSDVAALIAPRPCLIISGKSDPIFPIAPTRQATRALGKTYEVLGAGGNLDSDFFEGDHSWSNRKSLGFLKKHFG